MPNLVRKVCTVEIIPTLGEAATQLLRNLGYENVSVKVVDGYHGWQECGRWGAQAIQQLTVAEKIAERRMKPRAVMLVRFVPFTRTPN